MEFPELVQLLEVGDHILYSNEFCEVIIDVITNYDKNNFKFNISDNLLIHFDQKEIMDDGFRIRDEYVFMITNYKLIAFVGIIYRGFKIDTEYHAFHYRKPIVDCMNYYYIMDHVRRYLDEELCEDLTFADFLPRTTKSARK